MQGTFRGAALVPSHTGSPAQGGEPTAAKRRRAIRTCLPSPPRTCLPTACHLEIARVPSLAEHKMFSAVSICQISSSIETERSRRWPAANGISSAHQHHAACGGWRPHQDASTKKDEGSQPWLDKPGAHSKCTTTGDGATVSTLLPKISVYRGAHGEP